MSRVDDKVTQYVRADKLKVGDTFFCPDNHYGEARAQVITGVGTASVTYRGGFLWLKRKTRPVVKVAAMEIARPGWPLNDYVSRNRRFTFSPSEGVWIA